MLVSKRLYQTLTRYVTLDSQRKASILNSIVLGVSVNVWGPE